ncbi:MAG: type II toxin-antitoxin system VapC family toxin [Candidatus Baldrarchaeia archaeon]
MYLFDTDFIISLSKSSKDAKIFAQKVDREHAYCAVPVISAYEYLMGIYYLYIDDSDKLREKLRKAEAALKRFDILPCTYEIAKKTAEIDAYLTRQGQTVELADLIIAATAIIHNLTIVTKNVRHFSRIPKVQVITY